MISARPVDRLQAYIRRGNRSVDGWLASGSIEMIRRISQVQAERKIQGHVAEIGVHHGRLFILLALLAGSSERGIAIDLFEQQHLNSEQSGRGDRAIFMENLKRHANDANVIIHEGDSTKIDSDFIRERLGGSVRLFSVDGGHTAAITLHDLETAEGALAEGGVIILDDCFAEEWPDVSTGFHRFFAKPRRVVPFATGRNKTFLTTPEMAAIYREALSGCGTREAEREFIGHATLCVRFDPLPLKQRIKDALPILHKAYSGARRRGAATGVFP